MFFFNSFQRVKNCKFEQHQENFMTLKTVTLFTLSLFTLLLSCSPKQKEEAVQVVEAHAEISSNKNEIFYTTLDTVKIVAALSDSISIPKEEYNKLVDQNLGFFKDYIASPDFLYNTEAPEGFSSEVDEDFYFLLYAHFIKQQNGEKIYAEERKKLITLFTTINEIYANLQDGGTYFGHQYDRIQGYAEYAVYQLKNIKKEGEKTYAIGPQKKLYIQSLHQLIEDESSIDYRYVGKEKIDYLKKMHQKVNQLDSLITSLFYLRQTQEFQYTHYNYY